MGTCINIPVAGSGSGGTLLPVKLLTASWSKTTPYQILIESTEVSASSTVFCSLNKQPGDIVDIQKEYDKLSIEVTEGAIRFTTETPITHDLNLNILINDI